MAVLRRGRRQADEWTWQAFFGAVFYAIMKNMRRSFVLSLVAAFLSILSGCASLDGRGLVPGKSTGKEAEALMGAPAARLKTAGGDEVLYYPRQPEGRVCYAVSVGADGVMKSMEQRLNRANFARIVAGKSTRDQVRELLGPPFHILDQRLKGVEVWEYPWLEIDEKRVLFVEISPDGVVRRVDEAHDQVSDRPSES